MVAIRRKLEPDPSKPRYFITEPGFGLRFVPEGIRACNSVPRSKTSLTMRHSLIGPRRWSFLSIAAGATPP